MRWYGTIDRFEASKAVILPEDSKSTLIIEKSLLPEGCRAGDRIRFEVSIEDNDQDSRKRHVQDLIDQLSRKTK